MTGTQTWRARVYGIVWGVGRECRQTWWKANWNLSARLKELKIRKRKVELKGKKHGNVKLKEDVPGVILPREKPEERTVKQLQRTLDRSCLWYSIKCQTTEVPEVICAQRHTTTCMSQHN